MNLELGLVDVLFLYYQKHEIFFVTSSFSCLCPGRSIKTSVTLSSLLSSVSTLANLMMNASICFLCTDWNSFNDVRYKKNYIADSDAHIFFWLPSILSLSQWCWLYYSLSCEKIRLFWKEIKCVYIIFVEFYHYFLFDHCLEYFHHTSIVRVLTDDNDRLSKRDQQTNTNVSFLWSVYKKSIEYRVFRFWCNLQSPI